MARVVWRLSGIGFQPVDKREAYELYKCDAAQDVDDFLEEGPVSLAEFLSCSERPNNKKMRNVRLNCFRN